MGQTLLIVCDAGEYFALELFCNWVQVIILLDILSKNLALFQVLKRIRDLERIQVLKRIRVLERIHFLKRGD